MPAETITLETDRRGIATLTLSRPDRHNAMNAAMIAELAEAAAALPESGARAVVLTGAGRSFSAGADLGWMREQMQATRDERMAGARALAGMLRALDELPLPLIGRINGQAFGGGIGLIAVCDVAIAAADARFGLTETRLGLIPATISPYVVARLTPPRAREVFFSGRLFGAEEAVRLGLVAEAVPAEELDAAVERQVAPCLATAPGAVAEGKALVRALSPPIDDALIERTAEALADRWETDEAKAGIAAFFDKRPPPWAAG
ncbi:MAG TPA: crotonase/enoyl-CoA hydratase family protein [Thermohalobaculum sp.]|nr:crotonase/enoyl-CoA hydratase family protein [Thermohalobaculum sp.]